MTLTSILTLLLSMVALAVIPGPGILAVIARSSTGGFRHAVSTTAGIVIGDFVFITFALLGLATLSGVLGNVFIIVKYVGAVYLIWLGLAITLSKPDKETIRAVYSPSHLASFSAGLVITLSNPKAILFYVSVFPTLLDLSQLSVTDAAILYLVATVAVGGVMLGYGYITCKAKTSYETLGKKPYLRYGSGAILVASGIYVAIRG